jgi:hypothetical protein
MLVVARAWRRRALLLSATGREMRLRLINPNLTRDLTAFLESRTDVVTKQVSESE